VPHAGPPPCDKDLGSPLLLFPALPGRGLCSSFGSPLFLGGFLGFHFFFLFLFWADWNEFRPRRITFIFSFASLALVPRRNLFSFLWFFYQLDLCFLRRSGLYLTLLLDQPFYRIFSAGFSELFGSIIPSFPSDFSCAFSGRFWSGTPVVLELCFFFSPPPFPRGSM